MSVIVALKANDRVYLACDSQGTCGESKVIYSCPSNFKIWNVENADTCIMGSVGPHNDACAIKACDNLVRDIDYYRGIIDYEYIIDRVEPMIKDTLKEHMFISNDNPYKDLESRFVFAIDDKLFTIDFGAVYEYDDYTALGSGSSEAIGSLVSTNDCPIPEIRLINAIKASAINDLYVSYPIIITDTKTREYHIIDRENEEALIMAFEEEYYGDLDDDDDDDDYDSDDDYDDYDDDLEFDNEESEVEE